MSTAAKPLDTIEAVGGHPAVDFVNTVHSWRADPPPDYLHGFDDFVDWNLMAGLVPPKSAAYFKSLPPADKADVFAEGLELRTSLHRIFVAMTEGKRIPHGSLDHLNDLMRRTVPWRRLAVDDASGCTTVCSQWDFSDAPAIASLGPVTWMAADLLENGRLEHLKECPGESCGWLFLDVSKNHSRTWCSMKTCGNSAKVKRFRKRASS